MSGPSPVDRESSPGPPSKELQGFEEHQNRGFDVLDVLRDRLGVLGVPILAGLPLAS